MSTTLGTQAVLCFLLGFSCWFLTRNPPAGLLLSDVFRPRSQPPAFRPIPVSFRLCNSNPVDLLSLPPSPRRHRNSCRFDPNPQKAQAARPDKSGMVCCGCSSKQPLRAAAAGAVGSSICRACMIAAAAPRSRPALPSATTSDDFALLRQIITSGPGRWRPAQPAHAS